MTKLSLALLVARQAKQLRVLEKRLTNLDAAVLELRALLKEQADEE